MRIAIVIKNNPRIVVLVQNEIEIRKRGEREG